MCQSSNLWNSITSFLILWILCHRVDIMNILHPFVWVYWWNSSMLFFFFSGVGVILVTVSGAAWRMTAPGAPPCLGLGSTVDLGRCSRRPCGRNGSTPHGLLYPEFQHRPPPPSYQASMQEYRLRWESIHAHSKVISREHSLFWSNRYKALEYIFFLLILSKKENWMQRKLWPFSNVCPERSKMHNKIILTIFTKSAFIFFGKLKLSDSFEKKNVVSYLVCSICAFFPGSNRVSYDNNNITFTPTFTEMRTMGTH